jgi:hypothetical protein
MANVSHIKLPNGTVLDLAGGGGGLATIEVDFIRAPAYNVAGIITSGTLAVGSLIRFNYSNATSVGLIDSENQGVYYVNITNPASPQYLYRCGITPDFDPYGFIVSWAQIQLT